MAIVTASRHKYPGGNYPTHSWAFATATTLDAASEKHGVVFHAPKAGNISKIGFRTGTVTTGDDLDVRLETVSATTGLPTGTLATANSNGTQTVGAGDDDTWFETTLTASHTAARNDELALVLVNGAVPGVMNIANLDSATSGGGANSSGGLPYVVQDVGAGFVKRAREVMVASIGYDDGSYEMVTGFVPATAEGLENYNTGDANDEMGVFFTLPYPIRLAGSVQPFDMNGSDGTMKLYDSDGTTVLASRLFDNDIAQTSINNGEREYLFDSSVELAKDTNYRLAFLAAGANDLTFQFFDVASNALLGMFPGGINYYKTHRNAGGAWTQTTTRRPIINLLIDGYDNGAGGSGGLITHPGMAGGHVG